MNYLFSFIFCGLVCSISQFVLEKTKFTPGHINTILVIVGCFLTSIGIYDKLLSIFNCGASTPIMNFGYLLTKGAYEGYKTYGFIGLFKGIYSLSGAGLSTTIFISFITCICFKVKH